MVDSRRLMWSIEMRRQGFTLIEVLVAAFVAVAIMLVGVRLSQAWWQYNQEELFFTAFTSRWQTLMQRGATTRERVTLQYFPAMRKFRFGTYDDGSSTLLLPASVQVDMQGNAEIVWRPGVDDPKQFSSIRSIGFTRANGSRVKFSYQLGWGVLIRTNE